MKKIKPYQQFAIYYDSFYHWSFYRSYVEFIKDTIKAEKIKGVKILDAACGTGILIKEISLIMPNCELFGIDFSKNMVKIAKKKNPLAKIYFNSLVSFNISEKFNIITSTFDSVNYFLSITELKKVFKNLFHHLEKNGLFIFDFNTVNKKMLPNFSNGKIKMENKRIGHLWHCKIIFGKKYIEHHIERLYELREIKSLLKGIGFKNIKVYSDFKKGKNISYAPRLFVTAKK